MHFFSLKKTYISMSYNVPRHFRLQLNVPTINHKLRHTISETLLEMSFFVFFLSATRFVLTVQVKLKQNFAAENPFVCKNNFPVENRTICATRGPRMDFKICWTFYKETNRREVFVQHGGLRLMQILIRCLRTAFINLHNIHTHMNIKYKLTEFF